MSNKDGAIMKLCRLRVLRGPNVWAACPVLEAGVDVSAWAGQPSRRSAQAWEQLRAWLPSLGKGDENSRPVHVFERLWLHLQILAGNAVHFRDTRPMEGSHHYRVAIEYQEEPVGRACLHAALALCGAAWEGRPYAVNEELGQLRRLADEQRLGPSTLAIVEAALTRQVPVDHFNPESGRYLLLGQGARQRRTLGAETEDISALARTVTTNKYLTKQLLRQAGVPVPAGRPAADADDAWKAACELGLPVVVKPQNCDWGLGVAVFLRTREQVQAAYQTARIESRFVLVERFLVGTEHRVLVVADSVVAVARMEPPHVVGDGVSSVAELVEAVNRDPRRGDAWPAPLGRIKIDAVALELLAEQGHALDSVPPRGARVLLRRQPPHLDHGGWPCDVTEAIHPETAACAVAAAQALRVRVAGIDVLAADIARPLEEQGGGVVEVNTEPGLDLHLAPMNDHPRPVGAAIVASLFPPGCNGRIPVLAVTGSRAPAAGRCLAALLTEAGQRVGRASRDGVFIAGRKINLEDATVYDKARAVLRNSLVDIAVLECDADDLLREGFGCDRCDVALVTDLAEAKGNGIEEAVGTWTAFLHALAPDGKVVLNADDPPASCSLLPPTDRLLWFAQSGNNVHVTGHRAAGGTAIFLSADSLVVAHGVEEQRLAFGGRPMEHDPHEQLALLAALAGAMSLNQCGDEKPLASAPLADTVEAALATA